MSEQNQEVTAAATGAAAAVAAVQDDQAEAERQQAMELETMAAADAATAAREQAEQASQAATAAAERASQAEGTAEQAATQAYNVQDDIAGLRNEITQGWESFRTGIASLIDERLAPNQADEQPTEVVVTHDKPDTAGQSDHSAESRSDGRSQGSAAKPGDSGRSRRHRFGR